MILDILFPAIGTLLSLLVLVDLFLTVFHPTARAGPLTRVQSRSVWRLMRKLGGCSGKRRVRLLSLGGPLIAVLTPVSWIVLLTVAFALIYWPFIGTFSFDGLAQGPGWAESLYYSGYVATTLGLGDVVPRDIPFRLLAVVQGASGFATFSVAITYVLSVYGQQGVQTALANHVEHALAGTSNMDWRDPGTERERWAEHLAWEAARTLARVNTANSQYPILHYFRHPNPRDSLQIQIGRLIRWLRDLEAAAPRRDWFRGYSPFLALRRAIDDYLREVPLHLHPFGVQEEDDTGWDEKYRELLTFLCYEAPEFVDLAGDAAG